MLTFLGIAEAMDVNFSVDGKLIYCNFSRIEFSSLNTSAENVDISWKQARNDENNEKPFGVRVAIA